MFEFKPLISGSDSNYVLGGLEPDFRVPFSAIFHDIALGNCHQGRKAAESSGTKSVSFVAALRTIFVFVIPA